MLLLNSINYIDISGKKMRHVKSNLNILKPKKNISINLKSSKSNKDFTKSPSTLIKENNLNLKTIYNNSIFNFFEKSYKNSIFSSIPFNSNKTTSSQNKKNNFNHKNKTNYSSSSNNIFNNNSNSANRGISIKLNFNNKIINNNFTRKNKANKSNKNTKITKISNNLKNININNSNSNKYEFNISEKIKEKDKQITLLQKDFLQSQKLLNQLQEEKQKEIYSAYNTIKNVDKFLNYNSSCSINENHSGMRKFASLSDFFLTNNEKNLKILKKVYGKRSSVPNKSNSKKIICESKNKRQNKNIKQSKKKNNLNIYINTTSLARFNYFNNNLINQSKNCKTRNNIHKKHNFCNFNSGPNSNTNKKPKNFSQNKLMRLFSYSPNKILSNYFYNYDSKSKNVKKNINNNYNINNQYNIKSPSSAQNRVNNSNIINKFNNFKRKDLNYIINKGEDLKTRTRNLLNNYIMLSYQINWNNNKNK